MQTFTIGEEYSFLYSLNNQARGVLWGKWAELTGGLNGQEPTEEQLREIGLEAKQAVDEFINLQLNSVGFLN